MSGNAVEVIHRHLETTVHGVTIAGGYQIPTDFRLVTRTLLMWDQTGGRYPAAIIQVEDVTPEPIEFAYGFEARMRFRVILYFKAPGPDEASTLAHAYLAAVERGYMQDISRGGHADWTEPVTTPTTLIWRDNGQETVFEATSCGVCVYEYNPREGAGDLMEPSEKQRWRFELGRFPKDCKVFLNDELWRNVLSLKIEAGVDTDGKPKPTILTFSVFPDDIQVDVDPSLEGEIPDGLFGAR